MKPYQLELFKAALSVGGSIITLTLAWFVGNRISNAWTLRQKRKEIYLGARTEFFRLYGEFFAIWKAWNYFLERSANSALFPEDVRWEMLCRACAAEAGVEAIFVRLSTEHRLSKSDIENLGRFRQAYQRLRKNILKDQPIPWVSADHPEYRTFKRLACVVVELLDRLGEAPPNGARAQEHLLQITSNVWENSWVDHEPETSEGQKPAKKSSQ